MIFIPTFKEYRALSGAKFKELSSEQIDGHTPLNRYNREDNFSFTTPNNLCILSFKISLVFGYPSTFFALLKS